MRFVPPLLACRMEAMPSLHRSCVDVSEALLRLPSLNDGRLYGRMRPLGDMLLRFADAVFGKFPKSAAFSWGCTRGVSMQGRVSGAMMRLCFGFTLPMAPATCFTSAGISRL